MHRSGTTKWERFLDLYSDGLNDPKKLWQRILKTKFLKNIYIYTGDPQTWGNYLTLLNKDKFNVRSNKSEKIIWKRNTSKCYTSA